MFRDPRIDGDKQISPTFMTGYPYPQNYHNMGQLQTPYQGKLYGVQGDYGPVQNAPYYTPQNPNYPYVLDKDFRASSFLPTEGCMFGHPGYFESYETQYPPPFGGGYAPPESFYRLQPVYIPRSSHAKPVDSKVYHFPYDRDDYPERFNQIYTKLPETYPVLHQSNDFPPFDKYY